jgi:hypothetical protein
LAEVRNVVTAVFQRRRIERGEPQRINPQPFQVVELADEPRNVSNAVTVRIVEGANHHLIEDGTAVPLRVMIEPTMGIRKPKIHEPNSLSYRENSSVRELLEPLRG